MYNWRILLGGAASAAILTVGIAAPAFAQPASRAGSPVSSLSGVTQTLGGSTASGILCDLPSIPMSGLEASAASAATGAPCNSSPGSSTATVFGSPASAVNGPAAPASSALPGLGSLSGSIPALGSAAGVVPSGTNVASTLPQVGSITGASQGTSASNLGSTGSLLPGTSGSSTSGSSTSGVSGILGGNGSSSGSTGLGSVTGTLNNVTGNLPGGNSITNDLSGSGS